MSTASDIAALKASVQKLQGQMAAVLADLAPPPPSPDGSTITAVGQSLVDKGGHIFSLVAGNRGTDNPPVQIAYDGATDTQTGAVVEGLITNGGVFYQKNSAGSWYTGLPGSWTQVSDPTAPPPSPANARTFAFGVYMDPGASPSFSSLFGIKPDCTDNWSYYLLDGVGLGGVPTNDMIQNGVAYPQFFDLYLGSAAGSAQADLAAYQAYANGTHDAAIGAVCDALIAAKMVPVAIRIDTEYQLGADYLAGKITSALFKQAWNRIAAIVAAKFPGVPLVWNVSAVNNNGAAEPVFNYYPSAPFYPVVGPDVYASHWWGADLPTAVANIMAGSGTDKSGAKLPGLNDFAAFARTAGPNGAPVGVCVPEFGQQDFKGRQWADAIGAWAKNPANDVRAAVVWYSSDNGTLHPDQDPTGWRQGLIDNFGGLTSYAGKWAQKPLPPSPLTSNSVPFAAF